MDIQVSDAAVKFFKDEVAPGPGQGIRIYGKVYGSTNVHDNYSVGILVEAPQNVFAQVEKDGLLIFAEDEDQWFFEDYNLEIDYDAEEDVPTYYFISSNPEEAAKQREVDAQSGASAH
ncbi:HesB/YadR/YfhF family protein [Aerococcus sanguinicola]|uniref:HesB/YadR/YfhF family protein n=1 Tax=Aerococcus TaxID=1375 RepID=UPI000B028060|nr:MULTISPECIES: iron-sulfur cluster biosynthesis family protein [Aerococcus]MDK7049555.1 iron-sulfur cluster biosynthesis family protein [Aerococcus sanguinicola]